MVMTIVSLLSQGGFDEVKKCRKDGGASRGCVELLLSIRLSLHLIPTCSYSPSKICTIFRYLVHVQK